MSTTHSADAHHFSQPVHISLKVRYNEPGQDGIERLIPKRQARYAGDGQASCSLSGKADQSGIHTNNHSGWSDCCFCCNGHDTSTCAESEYGEFFMQHRELYHCALSVPALKNPISQHETD